MHIHEIIIDGFKSYATRTVVSGFDPHFNAITGLNGTGKSNILDAICFVLGISNLSQVRVGNLQELVYKQGQAGVTKASVTVVFNNSDPAGSPVGYESSKQITVTRQIVINGKNKYMINGVTAQQNQVANLFHSVQLNVNNPHFLIMQGRITKVLNMKPPETLSMIEEAAGTRMFETKKQAALKTIEKKQLKVDEITRVMEADITPTLERLKVDKQNYLSWMSNNTELEQLDRFCIAFDYNAALEKVERTGAAKEILEEEFNRHQSLQSEMQAEATSCEAKAKVIERQRNNESEGEFQDLKRSEQDLSKDLVKQTASFTNQKENLSNERDTHTNLARQVGACEKSLGDKKVELQVCTVATTAKEAEYAASEAAVVSLRECFQNAVAGVTDEKNTELLSLPEQVGAWEKRAREALSQMQQGSIKTTHHKESLKELKKSLKTEQATHAKVIAEADSLTAKVTEVEAALSSLVYSEKDELAIRARQTELKKILSTLRDEVETLGAQLQARLKFEFRDPERDFDRSRVKGVVANLIHVKDPLTTTALELAAGGKLQQIVVDSELTASAILKNGALKKRATFLPLNKVDNRCVDPAKVNRAKQMAREMGGTAFLALELVDFDESVRNAIQHVFGNTIICSSGEIGRAITQDPQVRIKTVTLDGDCFFPGGTMSGGSKNNIGELLLKVGILNIRSAEFQSLSAEMSAVTESLKKIEAIGAKAKDLSSTLEVRRHALEMCQGKIAGSKYAQSASEIDRMEAELVQLEADALVLKISHDKAQEELKKLQKTEKNIKASREKVMKEMEAEVKTAAKAAAALKGEVSTYRHRRDVLVEEVSALMKELSSLGEQLAISNSTLEKLSRDVETLDANCAATKQQYDSAKAAVAAKQQELNACSKEIKELEKAKDKATKAAQAAALDARKSKHELERWEKDSKDCEKLIESMKKNYTWIESECSYFGQAGGNYDFATKNPESLKERLAEVKRDEAIFLKKLNKKAVTSMEKAESEYQELSRKKEVILNDKAKIEAVIEELDIKKAQALQTTWIKVNRDFGSIFSTLLPGTHAKLDPLEGCSVMDGLEVKVAFNGVWKDSLTELSGGQRSLLALSLILSLLLFKPAPMYILDEVDAALDLSHTQNIGLMLRTHFSASQFIVVSLKEGMFNNANVIFRTRFVDGVSAVLRTVTGGAKSKGALQIQDITDENSSPQKKRGKTVTKGKAAGGSRSAIEAEA